MSNISHIQLPNGNFYNIKDSNASQFDELTQAEYDALSQAEKENGTMYLITDGEPEYTVINDSVPIGAIQAYGGVAAPYGWLICDGAAVSRETYSELFTAIGTTYGPGDGSTTFNLPDLKGRVLIGESSSYAIGSNGGEATHTLTIDEMPSHTHTQNKHKHEIGYSGTTVSGYGLIDSVSAHSSGMKYTNEVTATNQNTGGGGAHNNMQPYLVGNYIIKALNTVSSSRLEELDPQQIIFDMFYPVGSYYETSDATFNPNEQWHGTWTNETVTYEKKVLLWTNPSSSSFSAQTIQLSLSVYNSVEITSMVNNDTSEFPITRIEVGKQSCLMGGLHDGAGSNVFFLRFRNVQVNTTGITFGAGTYCYRDGGNALGNDRMIPYKIYGIKDATQYIWHRTA